VGADRIYYGVQRTRNMMNCEGKKAWPSSPTSSVHD
jgi:hypothetical protein